MGKLFFLISSFLNTLTTRLSVEMANFSPWKTCSYNLFFFLFSPTIRQDDSECVRAYGDCDLC